MSVPRIHLTIITLAATLLCALLYARAGATGERAPAKPPRPPGPFSPSNARTADGNLIPTEQFIPAARCAKCHQTAHREWSESLHRNAGREPFYKESVDILESTRGVEATRHCESCHAPVAVFSGALVKGSKEPRTMDDEGVSCSVCHSITEARLDGTGSYTIQRPALLERADGTRVYGDVPDAAIMDDIPAHRRAVMGPLLKTPEFCAACHKSAAPPELNGYKFIRGFSTYDEWQQSGASTEAVAPFYRRAQRADCNTCHMPKVESRIDLAAKNGTISSHRWLGANTAAPLFYGQTKQVELTKRFLQSGVITADIFALRRSATGDVVAPLVQRGDNPIALTPGEEVTAEVVVFNRKAAHSFPPELRDMYEPWVEFEAFDQTGRTIYHSGYVKADKTLDESAHVYKSILLDERGRPFTRHQVWLGTIKAYDNFVGSGRSDIARFRFRVPADAGGGAAAVTLRARVNYRRFIQEYTDYVLARRRAQLEIPIVRMAEAEVRIVCERAAPAATTVKGKESEGASSAKQKSLRWNDYGIGLLEQAQYGAAAAAFRRASELDPRNPDLLISTAIAEMRTERYGPEREQLGKAAVLLDDAMRLSPTLPRARFYRAVVRRSEGEAQQAAAELAQLAREYPRDREVQRQLGQTLYQLGRFAEARHAFEAVNAIDPTDAGAYQFLDSLYTGEGRQAEAAAARSWYLLWRDDPVSDAVAARFYAAHPEWAEERVSSHAHGVDSPSRPTLTGSAAAPTR